MRVWEGGRGAKQTYFSFIEYGSSEKAYKAAVKYEKSLPEYCRAGRKKSRERPYCNSQSGVVGVTPRHHRGGFVGWRASWIEYDNGKAIRKNKDFYFSIFGGRAFDKAKQTRLKMTQE